MNIYPRFQPPLRWGDILSGLCHAFSRPDDAFRDRLENGLADTLQLPDCALVPSARTGLALFGKALGWKPEDEIIVPSFTYPAVPAAIASAGYRPVFADLEEGGFGMDPESWTSLVTFRTRAVIPTHLFGQPCRLRPILDAAAELNLPVIEDCAQATGARYQGKPAGSHGFAAYFSFYITKNLTALGGGMVVSADNALMTAVRQELASFTPLAKTKSVKELVMGCAMKCATNRLLFSLTLYPLSRILQPRGFDLIQKLGDEEFTIASEALSQATRGRAMNAVQIAVALRQLQHVAARNQRLRKYGDRMRELLADIPEIRLPVVDPEAESIYLNFPILSEDPEKLKIRLLRHGIDTARGYLRSCAHMPLFQYRGPDCPRALKAEQQILHLPLYPSMTEHSLLAIADAVRG